MLGMKMRMGVRVRVFRRAVLTRRPRAPGTPTTVHGIREYRALGHLLVPMIGEVILFRGWRAFHQMLVPTAIRFLRVQTGLASSVSMTLGGWYSTEIERELGSDSDDLKTRCAGNVPQQTEFSTDVQTLGIF